jgi:uncharacterized RDD family membrane protein YckC
MRCPKCHYLSFEPEPRCRNCGYDLSLSPSDLPIKTQEPALGPYSDFDLNRPNPPGAKPDKLGAIDLDALVGFPVNESARAPLPASQQAVAAVSNRSKAAAPPSTVSPSRVAPAPAPVTAELPLFVQSVPQPDDRHDAPLVKLPTTARPPLAVRRPTPDPPRLKAKYPRVPDAGRKVDAEPAKELFARDLLDLDVQLDLDARRRDPTPVVRPAAQPRAESSSTILTQARNEPVGAARRLGAAVIDLVFIGAINLVLVWLTLQVCALTIGDIWIVPLLPLSAFLCMLDAGYLLMFTAASGQTVGKMIAQIKVVANDAAGEQDDRVRLGQAAARALMTLPSVLALGLGFLPALVGEGRAVHDRIAHTRVVRA